MIVPLSWLTDYVNFNLNDPDASVREFSEGMTMSGSKIETVFYLGEEITNVVVGKILSIQKHENADSLLICSVDAGKDAPLTIVTGAKNLTVGDLVPVALDGSTLPGGKEIQKGELRGVLSEGMLCSISELGLTNHDYPDAAEHGIFVLTDPCEIGEDIKKVLSMDTSVAEFEITPNRPDCLSILGVARETRATFSLDYKTPDTSFPEDPSNEIQNYLSVAIEDQSRASRYSARVIKNVKIAPSPSWLRARLRNAGVRPINNIVDITNYVMLEYGQPMHAFDYRTVKNGRLSVRAAKDGETIVTLDGQTRKLESFMTVIADGEDPVAVAGIMGGEYSGIADDTKTVVFESANFDGTSTRKTSNKLGLRSEASARFEKGLDPALTMEALDRACHLVSLLGAGDIVSGVIDVDFSNKTPRTLPLRPEKINGLLGTSLSADEMREILSRLFFTVSEENEVKIPSFRADVEQEADLAEEIARIYGYNNIPTTLFGGAAEGGLSPKQKFTKKVHEILTALGLYEISTYSFVSPKLYDKLGLPENDPARRSVEIINPLGEDTSIMRTTLLPSVLESLSLNYNRRNQRAALYEIGRTYLPKESGLPDEQDLLAIGLYGGYDYYDLKGMIEEILHNIGMPGIGLSSFEIRRISDHPSFHPGATAAFVMEGEVFATLGQIHPLVAENFSLPQNTFAALVDLPKLFSCEKAEKQYRPLGRFPAAARDLALLCDEKTAVLDVMRVIQAAGGTYLRDIKLFDVYVGQQIPEGKKSLAFSLLFRSDERTLTVEEVDALVKSISAALARELSISLRA